MASSLKPRLTIFAIAASGLSAVLGTLIGALWLTAMSGFSLPFGLEVFFSKHPYLQLYGFVYLFIMGVSYNLIPRFKNKTISPKYAAYLALALFMTGIAVSFVSRLLGHLLLLVAGILHLFIVANLVRKPEGNLAITEYYFLASAFFLPFSLAIMAMKEAQGNLGFSLEILHLSLLGFPALMIFGVELRTIHFRLAKLRKVESSVALIFLVLANALSGLSSIVAYESLTMISFVFSLIAGLLFLRSLQIFENLPAVIESRMTERDKKRYVYFTRSIRFASLWLIVGIAAGLMTATSLVYLQKVPFAFRDSFIHSLSVGFLGSTIVGYAPILLPSILSGHAPYKGLSLLPLYLLSVGNLIRMIGSISTEGQFAGFWPTALAGPLILLAMAYFMLTVHRLREERMQENRLVQLTK
ncbi:MAG: hypothetical protein HYU02_02475 [Thaumarchaeota archaeon]|nr:hypothetical protein [Nitrososphaerota archaeon]